MYFCWQVVNGSFLYFFIGSSTNPWRCTTSYFSPPPPHTHPTHTHVVTYIHPRPEWLRVATCVSAYGFAWGYVMVLAAAVTGSWYRCRVPILMFLGAKVGEERPS